MPKYLTTASLEDRQKLVDENLLRLSEKYEHKNYVLLSLKQ
jgi:hypothetical protein